MVWVLSHWLLCGVYRLLRLSFLPSSRSGDIYLWLECRRVGYELAREYRQWAKDGCRAYYDEAEKGE